jgi:1-acyl-sn-glycerol-3-phosphate acyltransferase
MPDVYAEADTLTRQIADEVYKALGFSKEIWWRRFFEPLLNRPSSAFAEICTGFDYDVANYGFRKAAERILPCFIKFTTVNGAENIPDDGPLLIISNHPGTYDSLVIAANVPRNDLKILAGNIPFLKNMPATQNHMIHTTLDTHTRMTVLRKALRHLKSGGALLIFGSGGIDPEPAHMSGAEEEIDQWSPSIGFFMKKVPNIYSLVTIVSDVLLPMYINHPLTIFRNKRRDKQRISEFVQVIQQILSPGKILLTPRISFAEPICIPDFLAMKDASNVLQSLKDRAKQLLADHLRSELKNS